VWGEEDALLVAQMYQRRGCALRIYATQAMIPQ
jgi:hypothetical protein